LNISTGQVAIVDTQCTVVLNVYVKDPIGGVKMYDPSAPPAATHVNTVADAQLMVQALLKVC
jgi:hypothetical protein